MLKEAARKIKTDYDYKIVVENEGDLTDAACMVLAKLALEIARERGLLTEKEAV